MAARLVGPVVFDFWMKNLTPIGRNRKSQYRHCKSAPYRAVVRRKLNAFHNFMQCRSVAQEIMVMLSAFHPTACWGGPWMWTIKLDGYSLEWAVAHAMRNTFPEVLAGTHAEDSWAKFLYRLRQSGPGNMKAA